VLSHLPHDIQGDALHFDVHLEGTHTTRTASNLKQQQQQQRSAQQQQQLQQRSGQQQICTN
jgi:hypothetical protein